MTAALRGLPLAVPPRVLVPAALAFAFLEGLLMARSPQIGLGLVVVLVFAAVALVNLPLAVAVWVAVWSIKALPILSVGPTAIALLVVLAWAGAAAGHGTSRALADHPVLPALAGLLVAWLTLSALWARDAGAVWATAWQWWIALLVVVIVAGTVRTRGHVELVMAGFVAGAVLSAGIGLAVEALGLTSAALPTRSATENRLQGGSGDPNVLAAGIVPALALCAALLQTRRGALARFAIGLSVLLLAVGLVATESRGGLIAAGVALVAAVVVVRGRRLAIVGAVLGLLLVGGVWLAANPAAGQRLSRSDQGGNGRTDLWSVAWRMTKDQPVLGVGLDNFAVRSPAYALKVGELRFAKLIAERPHVVHNAYLQALAETGLPGLVLLLGAFGAAVLIAHRAARRYADAGDDDGAALAGWLVVALVGMMTASAFLSNGNDVRLWLLVGLAPALAHLPARPRA